MKSAVIAVLSVVAIAIAGCGSTAPAHSAPAACKTFATWVRSQGDNLDAGKNMSVLAQAIRQAPSGHLYSDMNTVQVNVTYAQTHPEADQVTQPDVGAALGDCESVNPGWYGPLPTSSLPS